MCVSTQMAILSILSLLPMLFICWKPRVDVVVSKGSADFPLWDDERPVNDWIISDIDTQLNQSTTQFYDPSGVSFARQLLNAEM